MDVSSYFSGVVFVMWRVYLCFQNHSVVLPVSHNQGHRDNQVDYHPQCDDNHQHNSLIILNMWTTRQLKFTFHCLFVFWLRRTVKYCVIQGGGGVLTHFKRKSRIMKNIFFLYYCYFPSFISVMLPAANNIPTVFGYLINNVLALSGQCLDATSTM